MRQPVNSDENEQKKLPYSKESNNEDWPDPLDFKVDRWQRSSQQETDSVREEKKYTARGLSNTRNLPRSRRRRV